MIIIMHTLQMDQRRHTYGQRWHFFNHFALTTATENKEIRSHRVFREQNKVNRGITNCCGSGRAVVVVMAVSAAAAAAVKQQGPGRTDKRQPISLI